MTGFISGTCSTRPGPRWRGLPASRAEFDADANLRDATVHRIQVVGEAARRVSAPTREAHPGIPWHKITGTRHRIMHDYLNVDVDIVWEVASAHLAQRIVQLEGLVTDAAQ